MGHRKPSECNWVSGRPAQMLGRYTGTDGRVRTGWGCLACRGKGQMDYLDQRVAGLSSSKGDPSFPCPRCAGTGTYWSLSGQPTDEMDRAALLTPEQHAVQRENAE